MRTYTLLLLFLFGTLNLLAQSHYTKAAEKQLEKYYNKKDFKGIYSLLSEAFQRSVDETSIAYFLESDIYEHGGKIKHSTYVGEFNGQSLYQLVFEKGAMDLFLSVDEKGKISGLQFLPHRDSTEYTRFVLQVSLRHNPLQSTLDLHVDSLVRTLLKDKGVMGLSIGVLHHGEWNTYGYGKTDDKGEEIPGPSTVFEIGSASKTFTTLLLAKAIQSGLAKADDDVRKYLPGEYPNLEYEKTPITLMNLVNHTSGLPRMPENFDQQTGVKEDDPYMNYSREMLLLSLKTSKLHDKPGHKWEYSNYGIAVVGLVLEQLYKDSFAHLLQNYICTPLGMDSTFLQGQRQMEMAKGYGEAGQEVSYWHLNGMAPAGGICSNTDDMLKYMKLFTTTNDPAVNIVQQPTFKLDQKRATGWAWQIKTLKDKKHLLWHNGGTGGFHSFCGLVKETGDIVVILSNGSASMDPLAFSLVDILGLIK